MSESGWAEESLSRIAEGCLDALEGVARDCSREDRLELIRAAILHALQIERTQRRAIEESSERNS